MIHVLNKMILFWQSVQPMHWRGYVARVFRSSIKEEAGGFPASAISSVSVPADFGLLSFSGSCFSSYVGFSVNVSLTCELTRAVNRI